VVVVVVVVVVMERGVGTAGASHSSGVHHDGGCTCSQRGTTAIHYPRPHQSPHPASPHGPRIEHIHTSSADMHHGDTRIYGSASAGVAASPGGEGAVQLPDALWNDQIY
jgi:hypothetical protein